MCDFHNSSKRCRVVMVKQDLRTLQVLNNNKGHPSKSQNWRERYRAISPALGQTHLVFSVNVSLNQSMHSWFNLHFYMFLLILLVTTPHFSQPIPVLVGDNSPFFPNFPPGFTVVRLPMTSWSGLRTPRGQQWKEDLCWAETWISSNLVRPIFSKNLGWNVEKHGEAVRGWLEKIHLKDLVLANFCHFVWVRYCWKISGMTIHRWLGRSGLESPWSGERWQLLDLASLILVTVTTQCDT